MPSRPERPADADYYERGRVELISQGDVFRDVPLAYPLPANELVVEAGIGSSRSFLSGPLEFGPAILITPSCSLGAQGAAGYGHPVRTLVPGLPLAHLVERGVVKEAALPGIRRFDLLINYMYLPSLDVDELEFSMPESVALLYMPVKHRRARRRRPPDHGRRCAGRRVLDPLGLDRRGRARARPEPPCDCGAGVEAMTIREPRP